MKMKSSETGCQTRQPMIVWARTRWRMLFPKCECRMCKDKGVLISRRVIKVCDCQTPRLREQIRKLREELREIWTHNS